MSLIHFKCTYDPIWAEKGYYEKFAVQLFGGNKCLVVAEKLSSNAHVHFQGYTSLSTQGVKDTIASISACHFVVKDWEESQKKRKEGDANPGRPRPVKAVKRTVDEKGFQYLCKEDRPPLYSQGFSQEEIVSLRKASDEHVDDLKNGLKEHLFKIEYPATPERALKRMRIDALEYYEKDAKRPRPMFQKDVLWAMWNHPQRDDAWKEFVAERI